MKHWVRGLAVCGLTLGVGVLTAMISGPVLARPSPQLVTDPALATPNPYADWQTLATPHFNIHFEQKQRVFAQRLAAIAERVHVNLTPRAGYTPAGKTEIVINDSIDMSNGAATVLPYRQFFIFMTPPASGELLDDGDWVEMVFTHEYMHVLHLDQADGFPGGLRKVLGRWFFTFPQIFNPTWISEGYAVWAETDARKGVGRGQSALYDAMMRAEVMNGLKDLSSLSFYGYDSNDWPYGQPYLYGIYFFQFIEETWGRQKVREFIAAWNRNFIPFRMDARARQVFGMNAKTLHARYQTYLQQRFQPEIQGWQAQTGKAAPEFALTGNGLRKELRSDGQGGWYYFENNGRTAPAIMHRTADGAQEKIAIARQLQQFDVHSAQGLLMSALRICNNTEAHADLYRHIDGHWKPLTECGRYIAGYWSPAGDRIAAVSLHDGQNHLDLLGIDGTVMQTLYSAPLGETLGAVSWHPQGNALVVARKPQGERWGLFRLDLVTGGWQRLPTQGELPQSPRYSADGQTLYYVDATDSRLNVQGLNLLTGQTATLTHTLTAVTDFDVAQQQLATMEYTAQGIALAVQPLMTSISPIQPAENVGLPNSKNEVSKNESFKNHNAKNAGSKNNSTRRENSVHDQSEPARSKLTASLAPFTPPDDIASYAASPIKPYNPLLTLRPTAWLALLGADSADNGWVELLASGSDVLGYHAWQVAPRVYYDQETWGGDLSYVFHRRLALLGTRTVTTEVKPTEDIRAIVQAEDRGQLVWMQPINSFTAAWQLNAGVAQEHATLEQDGDVIANGYQSNLAGISLMVDSTELYRASISPEEGRRIKLTAEKYDALGGGYYRGGSYALDWNEFITTWPNQVLALRWVEASADDEAHPLSLGGSHDSFETLAGLIGFGKTDYALRGYETGIPALSGDRLRLQTVEYRIPLASVFDGFMAPPIGLGKLSGTVFYDRGAAWTKGADPRFYAGAGAEITGEILLGFDLLPLNITIGAAKGLDDTLGTNEVYARIGAAF